MRNLVKTPQGTTLWLTTGLERHSTVEVRLVVYRDKRHLVSTWETRRMQHHFQFYGMSPR
jgi:hypothetical protein